MVATVIEFFRRRTRGEQTLLLISAAIGLHWAGIQVGQLAAYLVG